MRADKLRPHHRRRPPPLRRRPAQGLDRAAPPGRRRPARHPQHRRFGCRRFPLLALCPRRLARADRAAPHRQQEARHHRWSRTGSGRRPPRCCDARKQPPSAFASWNQRTASSATHSSTRSVSSEQRQSAHQPRHARETENRKTPPAVRRGRRKSREQHCPRHKTTGQKVSKSSS